MQSSNVQLGLIAALAMGLGFSLSSADAVGYPAGAAVSFGNNPVWSNGGLLTAGTPISVVTAEGEQGVVVTDLHAFVTDTSDQCGAHMRLDLLIDGAVKGSVAMGVVQPSSNLTQYESSATLRLASGIYVEPGASLVLEPNIIWKRSYCSGTGPNIAYTLSGYRAQP